MSQEKKKNPFQDTLNLPRTDFGIRANAAQKEPELIDRWNKDDLWEKGWTKNSDKEKFVLHDGPPYANGHIHLGHVLNKVLKDIVTKFRRMSGMHVPVKPGWDCHGLPIELKVCSNLKKDPAVLRQAKGQERVEFKKQCREYAGEWIKIQKEEFKHLGVVMDWDHPYITMAPEYEGSILRAFAKFVEDGYIQRKGKTVPWCASCQTVLAAAEIEYQDRKDPSIYVLFPLDQKTSNEKFPKLLEDNPNLKINFLVWTTTPWTLPLNRAVVLNAKAKYVLLQGQDNIAFVVAKDLADKICNILGIEKNVLAEFDSTFFENTKVNHCFIDNFQVPVLLDNSVLLDEGTACLHSAPGCGPEDYILGIKNNLEIFSPISADGKYTKGIEPEELEGMPVKDGQFWVLKKLNEVGNLLHKENIKHSYPHCWRCRNGLIFRATEQWFCDLQQNNLVKKTLKEIEKINFIPEWGASRLYSFVENRTEWCISRQRVWGVPIPALLCKKCDHAFINSDFVNKVAAGVAKEGIEFWDRITIQEMTNSDFINKDFSCPNCKNKDLNEFEKEADILDVWFDSGVSHYAVLEQDKKNLGVPADVYLEGSDQHRGWFQSSLLSSMILNEKTCAKLMVTHGFVVDEKGHKMSKSLGNVIAPENIIKRYSRDILRLWVASSDYTSDISISENILKFVAQSYSKIRNTCRFMLSNLYDFDIQKDVVDYKDMLKVDQYALAHLKSINDKIIKAYKEYDFAAVFHTLNSYCTVDLSSLYLDICKDRLYVEKADGLLRRSAQTVIYNILDTITKLMAPVFSFLAEEVSDYYQKDKKESIHLQEFATVLNIWEILSKEKISDIAVASQEGLKIENVSSLTYPIFIQNLWNELLALREVVLKAIEEKRNAGEIKHSLEAKVTLYIDTKSDQKKIIDEFLKLLKYQTSERFFKDWFIVSQFELVDDPADLNQTLIKAVKVKVEHAQGEKCPRCWQWEKTDNPEKLCKRCESVLKKA